MALARAEMLDRMMARDASWNGRFLTGVLTTGIYCLPSCPARKPKPENVRFFTTPEAARDFGLRACKRCRPDDFYLRVDPDRELVEKAIGSLRADPGRYGGISDLAREAGVGVSKLHLLCRRHFHATPHSLIAGARIAAARRRLENGETGVAEIAFDVGFGSLSSFQESFRRHGALTPTEYRSLRGADAFELRLPASYPVATILDRLGRDPDNPCLRRRGDELAFAFVEEGEAISAHVSFARDRVGVRLDSGGSLPGQGARAAYERLHRMLGLGEDPRAFERRAREWPELASLVARRRGLRIPRTADLFDGMVWVISGQQVSLPFAFTLYRRFAERFSRPAPGGLRTLPDPASLAGAEARELADLKFSRRKSEVLLDLAERATGGELELDDRSATSACETLLGLSGLGPWSVGYLAIRALGFADAVPLGDAGLRRALVRHLGLDEPPDLDVTAALMGRYTPYRSHATYHLWQSLEDPT